MVGCCGVTCNQRQSGKLTLRTVHLGAGALTLARYLQATRPGSEQLAVEFERGLLDEVTARLPLPAGSRLTVREGDAAEVVAALLSRRSEWVGSTDLVIDDLSTAA